MSQSVDYYGNTGGGGYLTGGSPFGSTSGSPGGLGRRSALSQSLRPITVKQFIHATQAHADADWMFENSEIGQVTLVAHVISVQKQTTNSVYVLDDGTGRLEARHWSDSMSEGSEGSQNSISANSFARVTGTIKIFGTKKYINASHIRPIQDPHEPFFHMLEVMTVQLFFDRGPPGSSVPGQDHQEAKPSISAYSAQAHQSEVKDQYSHLPPLSRSIVQFMLKQPPRPEGVHVGAIVRTTGADADAIEQALGRLMDDGIIFSTIDEEHFKMSE
ncbi:hypothetical protein BC834DRAFT_225016 [Gloeopeniophorella convolvens]|nr:hypothetical protein BC834DRAFT_225016 [Gloeopeniophorella convolvens]